MDSGFELMVKATDMENYNDSIGKFMVLKSLQVWNFGFDFFKIQLGRIYGCNLWKSFKVCIVQKVKLSVANNFLLVLRYGEYRFPTSIAERIKAGVDPILRC